MTDASVTAGLPSDPGPSRTGADKPLPPGIADILTVLQILLTYAQHLTATLERRATARSFSVIAQFFGTTAIPVILARLSRGMLRIQALQQVLLARAARGRDLVLLKRRDPAPRPPGTENPPMPPRQRVRHPDPAADPDALPDLAQLQAFIRRRTVGRAIADICDDLGIHPSLCDGNFWYALACAMTWYRGNMPRLYDRLCDRAAAFETELDRNPALDWPDDSREGVRRVLGFFIGESPAMPAPPPPPGPLSGSGAGPPGAPA